MLVYTILLLEWMEARAPTHTPILRSMVPLVWNLLKLAPKMHSIVGEREQSDVYYLVTSSFYCVYAATSIMYQCSYKPADIVSMYPCTYAMPKECLECCYYLYIHIGIMYTGLFTKDTAAKMASNLNRSM